MAKIESKLTIIRDIVDVGIPTSVRVARVAAPLMSPRRARIEAELFAEQQNPDELHFEDVVTLIDPRGRVIGGALVWEARWEKDPEVRARREAEEFILEELEFMLKREDFEEGQTDRLNPRMN